MSEAKLQHVNIMVDDLGEGVAFYRDVVGLELDDTPDLDFPSQFFKLADGAQIHMNEFKDEKPYRAHFCMIADDFNETFRRMKSAGVIDISPWGKVRRLDTGTMQMFARDPSGNLIEIASSKGEVIDPDILEDQLVQVSGDNALYKSGLNDPRRGETS